MSTSTPYQVAVLVGSLRQASFNRKLALALQALAPPELALRIVEIGHLPFYNEDEAAAPPAPYGEFRAAIKAADAVLFVSPEYNRSIPAALKNALDVGSRPYGQNAFEGKPGAVVTLSPGGLGGFGAHHHLRQVLVCLNVATLPTPEMYLGGAADMFTADGAIAKPDTEAFLRKFLATFSTWIRKQKAA
ncbi:NADPH-dependent FMN reductase [Roseateles amylovorans]|uniref:NAD(P)H-dependent oxidoreductase n=1 Tax=Roseateles amylovorans TaxID=2978473 RepID=A0ABY6AYZ7_9BURK|nr:NAD(P)H-dependent oxidoreductase [Roseateles amylovorans]UXH78142.1 NAD(P)H-dependent oxidoreductase [Roseateles amylovorans]